MSFYSLRGLIDMLQIFALILNTIGTLYIDRRNGRVTDHI